MFDLRVLLFCVLLRFGALGKGISYTWHKRCSSLNVEQSYTNSGSRVDGLKIVLSSMSRPHGTV